MAVMMEPDKPVPANLKWLKPGAEGVARKYASADRFDACFVKELPYYFAARWYVRVRFADEVNPTTLRAYDVHHA